MAYNSNQTIKEAKKPATTNRLMWKQIVVYLCIWFLIIALILIYFTLTGSPQAGLLEIGISTLIFVFSFYFIIKFFPFISKIFSLVIVTGFGIALVYVNYHFLKMVKKDASFEQLLIGDLLTHKIVKSIKKKPTTLATKEGISQTTSRYEKPLQVISLDQLKKSVANAIIAGPELSSMKPVALPVKAESLLVGDKYKIGMLGMKNANAGIRGLGFTKNVKSMIQERPNRNCLNLSTYPNLIRETSNVMLKINKTQPSLSENRIGIIPVTNVGRPLKESRILID